MTHTCTKTHRCRGQSWGRKAGKVALPWLGFPLTKPGPLWSLMVLRCSTDGMVQCVGKLMAGTLWEGMRFILNWENPSRLECSPGDSGRSLWSANTPHSALWHHPHSHPRTAQYFGASTSLGPGTQGFALLSHPLGGPWVQQMHAGLNPLGASRHTRNTLLLT